jgi:hypothetical protein
MTSVGVALRPAVPPFGWPERGSEVHINVGVGYFTMPPAHVKWWRQNISAIGVFHMAACALDATPQFIRACPITPYRYTLMSWKIQNK